LSFAHKKQKSKQQKRGEFFDARPADSVFGEVGDVGVAFFWLLFLAKQEK
jgi:hypothetical protein